MVLRISSADLSELRRHGEEAYPQECCGALLGNMDGEGAKTVCAVSRCGNTRTDSPHNRYAIDPGELVHLQREARRRGQEIIGFYHSHPDHAARWSEVDLAEAHWIGCSYVIISVENGRAARTNSFQLAGDEESKRFEDEPIEHLGSDK